MPIPRGLVVLRVASLKQLNASFNRRVQCLVHAAFLHLVVFFPENHKFVAYKRLAACYNGCTVTGGYIKSE